jgi:TatA/E family protein of Tat protein translocase
MLVIAVVALIIFGPRKLPELGRTVGRSLGEFKRASEDFKRTWEYEVEMERTARVTTGAENSTAALPGPTASEPAGSDIDFAATRVPELEPQMEPQSIARGTNTESSFADAAPAPDETSASPSSDATGQTGHAPTSKQDWL